MSIGLKSVGTWATSTSTTMTVTLPTHAAGDLLIVRAIRKPFTSPTSMVINTSGWAATGTPFANGSTANGAGVGSMAIATFWKIASSSSETNPVVTWGATAAPGAAVALVYERTNEFYTWSDPIGVGGLDSTAATTINDTLGTHISVAAGDMVDIFCGWCDDSGTPSAVSISQPSVTYSVTSDVPGTALDTSTSNDLAADGGYALATAGTSSGAATITASYGSSEQHIVWMTRLRETAPTPTQTSVAEVSLASVTDPADNTSHSLHVRARVTSGTGRMRMALYEGANNRSGDLESGDLTTSLADYSLPISEANAANITDYSDLSVRFWGYSVNGGSIVYEVDQIWFELPESSTTELSGTTSTSSASSTVVTGGGQRSGSATAASNTNAATVVGAGARSGSASGISNTSGIVVTGRLAASGTTLLSNTSGITSTGVKEGRSSSSASASNATSVSGNSARASAASTSSASGATASGSLGASGTVGVSNSSGVSVSGYKAATPSTTSLSHASSATTSGVRSSADSASVSHESDATASGDAYRASTTSATHASASSASGSSTRSSATSTGHSSDATVSGDRQSLGAATSSDVISTSSVGRKDTSGTTSASHVSGVVVDGVQLTGGQAVISHTTAVTMAGTSGRSGSTSASAASDTTVSGGIGASGASSASHSSGSSSTGTKSAASTTNLQNYSGATSSGTGDHAGSATESSSSSASANGDTSRYGAVTVPHESGVSSTGRMDAHSIASVSAESSAITTGIRESIGSVSIGNTSDAVSSGTSARSGSAGIDHEGSAQASGIASSQGSGSAQVVHSVATSSSGQKSTSSVVSTSRTSAAQVSGYRTSIGFLVINDTATYVAVSGQAQRLGATTDDFVALAVSSGESVRASAAVAGSSVSTSASGTIYQVAPPLEGEPIVSMIQKAVPSGDMIHIDQGSSSERQHVVSSGIVDMPKASMRGRGPFAPASSMIKR